MVACRQVSIMRFAGEAARNHVESIRSGPGRAKPKKPSGACAGSQSSSGRAQIVVASTQTPPWRAKSSSLISLLMASGCFSVAKIRARSAAGMNFCWDCVSSKCTTWCGLSRHQLWTQAFTNSGALVKPCNHSIQMIRGTTFFDACCDFLNASGTDISFCMEFSLC